MRFTAKHLSSFFFVFQNSEESTIKLSTDNDLLYSFFKASNSSQSRPASNGTSTDLKNIIKYYKNHGYLPLLTGKSDISIANLFVVSSFCCVSEVLVLTFKSSGLKNLLNLSSSAISRGNALPKGC